MGIPFGGQLMRAWLSILLLGVSVSQAQITEIKTPPQLGQIVQAYAQTPAESSAGLCASSSACNLGYPPGDARRYLKCDGATNESSTMAAVETFAESSGVPIQFPSATCIFTGVTINKPVTWLGNGTDKTFISNPSGASTAIVTVSISTTNFNPGTGQPAQILMRDLTLTSPNRSSGSGDAIHLIAPSSPYTTGTRVALDHVAIWGVAGNGINADCSGAGGCWPGFVEANNLWILYVGGIGITAISTADWFLSTVTVGGANGAEGVLFSGCSNMHLEGYSGFVNVGDDIDVFQSENTVIINSIIDETGKNGLNVKLTSGQRLDVIGSTFRWSSTATNATYSDLSLDAANAGTVFLTADRFYAPSTSPSSNKPLYNVNFNGGSQQINIQDVSFDLGAPPTAGISSNYPLLSGIYKSSSGSIVQYGGSIVANSNTTGKGFLVQNGSGTVAGLTGSGTNNAIGALVFGASSAMVMTAAAPTVTSGAGTSPSVTSVSGNFFMVTEGSTGTPSTSLVLAMPTATDGWACAPPTDQTSSTISARQSANTTTSVTITFSSAPANSDKILFNCGPF